MSIGPMSGVAASMAGTSLAQTRGADADRGAQDVAKGQLKVMSAQKAEAAAGIGETDGQDHETAERDADGRRPWEIPAPKAAPGDSQTPPPAEHSKDPSGESGGLLDLSG